MSVSVSVNRLGDPAGRGGAVQVQRPPTAHERCLQSAADCLRRRERQAAADGRRRCAVVLMLLS